MKKEQVLYYAINEMGVDVIENINGHDKGNYHFSDMEFVENVYPRSQWKYVDITEEVRMF